MNVFKKNNLPQCYLCPETQIEKNCSKRFRECPKFNRTQIKANKEEILPRKITEKEKQAKKIGGKKFSWKLWAHFGEFSWEIRCRNGFTKGCPWIFDPYPPPVLYMYDFVRNIRTSPLSRIWTSFMKYPECGRRKIEQISLEISTPTPPKTSHSAIVIKIYNNVTVEWVITGWHFLRHQKAFIKKLNTWNCANLAVFLWPETYKLTQIFEIIPQFKWKICYY